MEKKVRISCVLQVGLFIAVIMFLGISGCLNQGYQDKEQSVEKFKQQKKVTQPDIKNLDQSSWFSEVQKRIINEEYWITQQSKKFHAVNRAHNLRALFNQDGSIKLEPRDKDDADIQWEGLMKVTGFGRWEYIAPSDQGQVQPGECIGEANQGATDDCMRRLEISRNGFVEWYINNENGIEQGFDINEKPVGDGDLVIEVEVEGLNLRESGDGNEVIMYINNEDIIMYNGLIAKDSTGNELFAWMEVEGNKIRLIIADEGAIYPVLIDPLLSSPSWYSESNTIDACYGYSVSSAGDVNGDGYGDVIVGAPYYGDGEHMAEGKVYVFHGSSSGLSTTANWTAVGGADEVYLGYSVSSAGDVNGDGYGDVIVGAPSYANALNNEGGAFVFHGSSSGLSTTPDWTAESDQELAQFGYSVSSAGDVNGDGYGDVIVGAPYYANGQSNEGRAYIYHGSSSGLSTTADWTTESDQENAQFGYSVSVSGDVNDDGYADVIIGAPYYDNGQSNEGRAYIYHGSSSGLLTTADWTAESNQAYAQFGNSVSSAGDVNGDGYSDVIVGSLYYDNGQSNEGRAFVYYGNGGTGFSIRPRQVNIGSSVLLQPFSNSDSLTSVRFKLFTRTIWGRQKVKIQYEIEEHGVPFDGKNLGISSSWVDTNISGYTITTTVTNLENDHDYHWRARILYAPVNDVGGGWSPWMVFDREGGLTPDFRTPKG